MAKKFVLWDDRAKELGSATSFSRKWIRDFFSSPFWDSIPDKPFTSLGGEFRVANGELQVNSIDFSKITNRKISLIDLDASLIPEGDGTQDIGSTSKRWRTLFLKDGPKVVDDKGNLRAGFDANGATHIGHDLMMARTVDGDFKWKRALVVFPDVLAINYEGDFKNGVSVDGPSLKPNADGATDLGSPTNRWKTLYLSGGLRVMDDRGNPRAGFDANGKAYIGHDLTMARTVDGDFAWKRALVVFPDHLVINFAGDFTNGVEVDGPGLFPQTDGIGDIGEPNRRWNAIHAVTVSTGDVVFNNGWRITEYDNGELINGLRILDDEGNEVLRITEDGLYFRGRRVA